MKRARVKRSKVLDIATLGDRYSKYGTKKHKPVNALYEFVLKKREHRYDKSRAEAVTLLNKVKIVPKKMERSERIERSIKGEITATKQEIREVLEKIDKLVKLPESMFPPWYDVKRKKEIMKFKQALEKKLVKKK